MPGKYSHSVVLADYSSRGIIDLPDDQHVAYLRSSPYATSQYSRKSSFSRSEQSPHIQPRSQSALATVRRYTPDVGRNAPRSQRQVIIDGPSDAKDGPRNGPVVGQRPSTADRSWSHVPQTKQNVANPAKDTIHARTTISPTWNARRNDSRSIARDVRNGSTPAAVDSRVKSPSQSASRTLAIPQTPEIPYDGRSSIPPNQKLSLSDKPSRKLEPAIEMQAKTDFPSKNQHKSGEAPSTAATSQQRTASRDKSLQGNTTRAPDLGAAEPDFGGFSDQVEQSASYFPSSSAARSPKTQKRAVQATPHRGKLETLSPMRASTRVTEPTAKPLRSTSVDHSESEVLTELIGTPMQSVRKPGSVTSPSSVGSKSIGARTDPKKVTAQPTTQDWTLPEIDEDGAFGPDFFTQGPEDVFSRPSHDESIDSFLDRPLGTISAGRDIDFTKDDDEESEADAACPPDIGRFRDQEDAGSGSFLQSKKSDILTSKGASAPAQTPKAKKAGFFARLRSKSRPRA